MADDLKNTGKGNLFVILGEPDIEILPAEGDDPDHGPVRVRINGVDGLPSEHRRDPKPRRGRDRLLCLVRSPWGEGPPWKRGKVIFRHCPKWRRRNE